MANPAYVQSASHAFNGSSNQVAVTLGNTTAGNCLVVVGICGNAGVTINSVGDGGDTFASGVNLINDSTDGIVISYSYAVNISAKTTPTVTITWSTTISFAYILVWEISGTVTTGSPISVSQSANLQSPSTSTNATVNITPAASGELIIAAVAGANGGFSVSLGSGYSNLVGATDEIAGENKANATATSQAANFTLGSADSWGVIALSIKLNTTLLSLVDDASNMFIVPPSNALNFDSMSDWIWSTVLHTPGTFEPEADTLLDQQFYQIPSNANMLEYEDHVVDIFSALQSLTVWNFWDNDGDNQADHTPRFSYDHNDDNTILIFLPRDNEWDTDADEQLLLKQFYSIGGEVGDDSADFYVAWFVLPNWNPANGGTWDDEPHNQKDFSSWMKDHLSDESVEFITLPYNPWDDDAKYQLDRTTFNKDHLSDEGVEHIILALITGWDNDADNQSDHTIWDRDHLSDEMVELIQYANGVITGWDDDAKYQSDHTIQIKDDTEDDGADFYKGWVLPPWNPDVGGWDTDANVQLMNPNPFLGDAGFWYDYGFFPTIPIPPEVLPCAGFVINPLTAVQIANLADITLLDMCVNAGPAGWWDFCTRRYAAIQLLNRANAESTSWIFLQQQLKLQSLIQLKLNEEEEFYNFMLMAGLIVL